MDDKSFEARLRDSGLTPKAEDLPRLRALVADMDRAAALIDTPRGYAEEPLFALRLNKAGA